MSCCSLLTGTMELNVVPEKHETNVWPEDANIWNIKTISKAIWVHTLGTITASTKRKWNTSISIWCLQFHNRTSNRLSCLFHGMPGQWFYLIHAMLYSLMHYMTNIILKRKITDFFLFLLSWQSEGKHMCCVLVSLHSQRLFVFLSAVHTCPRQHYITSCAFPTT